MTELQPSIGPTAGDPQERSRLRKTFWAVVGRAYWRGKLNRVATGFVLFIILLTVFVPFLANTAPYSAVISGHREFPLFRDLTRVDWIWLLWGFLATVYSVFYWCSRNSTMELEPLRAQRLVWMLVLSVLGLLGTLGIVTLKSDYLDSRDYHQLEREGALQEAVFPPIRWGFADQEPLEANRLSEPPSKDHRLGTDTNGRDVFARLLWSTRVVLEIGLISEGIALLIGAIYGALMGYFVGKVDIFGMRFVEIVEAIPLLFLLITFVAIFGRQLFMIMVIIGVTGWTGIARFVRAEFLRIRQLDYVTAAKAMGLPLRSIL